LTIRHLAHRIGHEFSGSIAGLAKFMGKSDQMLTNKLNTNSESHHLYIEEFETMVEFADKNFEVAAYFAEKAGAVVVKLPERPESDMVLLDLFMSSMKELGEVSGAFQKAYADGDITMREFGQISLEIDDVLARLLEFKAAVKRVVR